MYRFMYMFSGKSIYVFTIWRSFFKLRGPLEYRAETTLVTLLLIHKHSRDTLNEMLCRISAGAGGRGSGVGRKPFLRIGIPSIFTNQDFTSFQTTGGTSL